jgi:hypothetical protein
MGVDLWHGLIFENSSFSFRDEDFENYLKENYKCTVTHVNTICNYFLKEADKDEYSSIHLGIFLSLAKKKNELLKIVLDRKHLEYPSDPIKNKEVIIERTRLAMQLCSSDPNNLDFLKLQMLAAETAKTNKILENVLINNAELAASYGNVQTNQKLFFQAGNPGWFGTVHFRSAAFFSRNVETHDLANEHLKKAENWVHHRRHLSEHEQREYNISKMDLAYGAEAVLRLYGVEECIKWLKGWKPRDLIYEVLGLLFSKLIIDSSLKEVENWLKVITLRTDVYLKIIEIALRHGLNIPIDIEYVNRTLQRFIKTSKKEHSLNPLLVSFCEYYLKIGKKYNDIKAIVDLISVEPPNRVPGFYGSYGSNELQIDMSTLIRKLTIKKLYENLDLKTDLLYPKKIVDALNNTDPKEISKVASDKRKMDILYNRLLPIYNLRFKCLIKKVTKAETENKVKDILSNLYRNYEFSSEFGHEAQYIDKFIALLLVDICFIIQHNELLEKIKETFPLKDRNNIELYTQIAQRLSISNKYSVLVIKILAEIDSIIQESNFPGSEQVDHYINCAIIGSKISKNTGKFYFDKMVHCSSEVDMESYDQIRCVNDLFNSEKPLDNPKLAFDFARYIEYCKVRMSGYDHFPWSSAIEGLKQLDLISMYSILCRWDQRDVIEIPDHLSFVLHSSLERNFINTVTAASLIPLNQYDDSFEDLLSLIAEQLNEEKNSRLKESILNDVIRDLKIDYNGSQQLLDILIDKNSPDSIEEPLIEELIKYRKKLNSFAVKESNPLSYKQEKNEKEKQIKSYQNVIQKIDFTDYSKIEDGLKKLSKGTFNNYVNEELFFNLIKKRVQLDDQVKYLDALVNLSDDAIRYWSFEKNIRELLTEWKYNPEVIIWKKGKFITIVKTYFSHFIEYGHVSIRELKDLAELFSINDSELKNVILKIIPDHLSEFSPATFYQFFKITATGIKISDKIKLMEWVLPKWGDKIKADFGDGEFNKNFAPQTNSIKAIAGFLRYSLGHPDKRIRWRASHALRRLAKLGESEILIELLAKQNEISSFPYQDKSYPFYWISAKLHLWITIERISKENPKILIKHAKSFVGELQNSDLPHAQINYFIKSTCLQLLKQDNKIFTKGERDILNNSLVSQIGEAKTIKTNSRESNCEQITTKFSFDGMDTLPYWYEPLGDAFDLWRDEVVIIADKYITQKWGYTNENVKEYRIKHRDWDLVSHRHGSEPTIETLSIYLEYHAMFCAATELLKTKPTAKKDSWHGGWDNWIQGWANCWDDHWLYDFRDPIPLEKRYRIQQRTQEDWEWGIERIDFDTCIGLNDSLNKEYLIVHGYNTIHFGKDYETNSVSSVLVNPKTAYALLLTLQTSNKYDFYLPYEDDDDINDDMESAYDEFKMIGWISKISTQRDGIDDKDELYNDISKSRLKLGERFTKWCGIVYSPDYRFSFRSNNPEEKVTILETWSNTVKENRHSIFTSSGYRLSLRKKDLLSFLQNENKCLIISCELTRRLEYEKRSNREKGVDSIEMNNSYTLIYLIYPNGKIETISGNHKLR